MMTLGELLDAARTSLVRLDTSRLAQLMSTGEAIVLDTRTPTDRENYGCIPGSIHTPLTGSVRRRPDRVRACH